MIYNDLRREYKQLQSFQKRHKDRDRTGPLSTSNLLYYSVNYLVINFKLL
jgi:hypothetical protein